MLKKIMAFSLAGLLATQTNAAGYQLQEYSVVGLGRSFAGSGIMGDDYSALAYNPAGMEMNKRSGGQLGLTGIDVRTTVFGYSKDDRFGSYNPSSHTFTRLFRLMPNLFAQYKINDKTTIGAGIYAPFGLATDYPNGWYGSVHGDYSGITVADFTPAISHKITDTIAFGLGLNIQYAVAHLTGGIPISGATDIRGDDFGVGYIAGLTWQPVPETRLGLSYRSHVRHKLNGHNEPKGAPGDPMFSHLANGRYSMSARITTPETVLFSVAQDVGKKWTLSGLVRWTKWSRFDRLTLNQENAVPLSTTNEHWRDTWFLSLGADYKFCKNLTFRFGSAYDQGAVREATYRTARIPDARRIWLSGGLSYQRNDWQLDLGYSHLFIRQVDAYGVSDGVGEFSGRYDSKSDIVGLQFQYKF